MSMRLSRARIGRRAAALGLLALAGCSVAETPRQLPGGYRLVQKDPFQALYGPDGRIVRLLLDRDHDGRADAVIVYGRNGKPERGEIDTDGDGSVDRWEHFRPDGTLERVDVDTNRDGRGDGHSEYPQ
jgi:hypothetical protein